MLITTLDNQQIKWNAKGHRRAKVSEGHKSSLELLKTRWPTVHILEEVSIPVRKGKTLFLDLYVPQLNIAVEYHGEQHFYYTSLYHRSALDFIRQKRNDRDKRDWCELNGIILIEFDYRDNIGHMEAKLNEC